jgi:PEP-CTERM motif
MRKWLIVLAVFTIALMFGSKNASAQTEIQIGPILSNTAINFNGAGGSATMTFGACGVGACTISNLDIFIVGASIQGSAVGTLSTTSTATYGLTSLNGLTWTVATGPTMAFSFSPGGAAGSITGTVVWNQVISNGGATLLGTFTVTGASGTLASTFNAGPYPIDFTAEYSSSSLSAIFNGTSTSAVASLSETGAISAPAPTPEPSSILLFGTGLLGLGGILRRRLFA